MNESERTLLMPFLQKLVNSQITPGDAAANNLIQDALRSQPNAGYLLVQRALALEADLAAAELRIAQLEGKVPAPVQPPPERDFLNLQTAQWGEQGSGEAGVTTSKMLYDLFIQPRSSEKKDFESRVVSFVEKNSVWIWLVIALIVVLVVRFKDRLV
jgi:hypothetical protein